MTDSVTDMLESCSGGGYNEAIDRRYKNWDCLVHDSDCLAS